ncbi:MAG: GAF domain-containing protein, partial [Thermodesulfobacteriota bacterium]
MARLISATMVRLSLIRGNVEESAYGYVTHAITVGPVRGDYESAYEFGRLALKVNERFNDSRRRAKIYQQFHAHVNFWRQPMRTCIPYAQEACRSGLESGDFLYAAYGASTESWPAILSNQDLAQFVRHFTPNLALIKKLKITSFADSLRMIMNWALALQGETESPLSLSDEGFDENEYVEAYRDNPFFTMFHGILKLHLFYVFGEYSKALETSRTVGGIVHQLTGMVWSVMFDFWNGLTLAANYAAATPDQQRVYLREMENARKLFAVLAENCPENYLCQKLMLSAEIERVTGRQLEALELYERAIVHAGETTMLQHRALANELCARFWLDRGQEKVAAAFMVEARAFYAQWGAMAKVRALEEKYPHLFSQSRLERGTGASDLQATLSTIRAGSETLDLMSVIKASQAISGEILLSHLLEKLMKIAIENAGAERGILILEKEGNLIIETEGSVDKDKDEVSILNSAPVGATGRQPLPETIVNYVKRSSQSVVLDDAQNDSQFGNDPYISQNKLKSILCTPILSHGKLIGILYLENKLTTDAFTPDRIRVMQILSSQAAISLENARLYDESKSAADELRFLNDLVE